MSSKKLPVRLKHDRTSNIFGCRFGSRLRFVTRDYDGFMTYCVAFGLNEVSPDIH